MISDFYKVQFPLDQFIDGIFYYSGYVPEHEVDRFLPDGNVQLIFSLKPEIQYIYDNYSLTPIQKCSQVWFSGQRTLPITIPSGRDSEMLIVFFKKGKSFPFVHIPLREFTNQVVDANLVMGNDVIIAREKILNQQSLIGKFLIIVDFLLMRLLTNSDSNPCIDYAINYISNHPHQTAIKSLSDKIGYSQKHLASLFHKHLGLTPKEFLKIVRFQKVVKEIDLTTKPNWNHISIDCVYYDQSHFINDFKHFSGFTPVQYFRKKGDYLNYIPIK